MVLNCILPPSTMTNMARRIFWELELDIWHPKVIFWNILLFFIFLRTRPKLQCNHIYHISEQEYIKGRKGLGLLIATGLPHFALVWLNALTQRQSGFITSSHPGWKLSLFESLSWGQSLRGIIAVRVTEVTGNDFHIYIGNWASLVGPNTNACKDSGWCVRCLGRHISYNGQGGPYDRV